MAIFWEAVLAALPLAHENNGWTTCFPGNKRRIKIKSSGVSLSFQHFGNSLFNEKTINLSYGKSFGNINAGLLFEWLHVKFQGLETGLSFLQTGLFSTIKIGENVFAGINILNPRIIVKSAETEIHPASSLRYLL